MVPQGSIPEDWDVSPEALRSWRVKAYHAWCASWHKVRSVDRSSRTIMFENPVSERASHTMMLQEGLVLVYRYS
eukprot:COSAG06_NODE_333_length_17341_cov_7.601032_12_plen_74_part_00